MGNKTLDKIRQLPHIESVDREPEGYFIYFSSGYCWDGDPCGACHYVMEETANAAIREAKSFRVCNCEGCQLDRSKLQ